MSDCIFCKIIEGEIPAEKIYGNEEVLAFLDINPHTKGHSLVLPKRHYENMSEAPEDTLAEIMSTVKEISPAIMKAVGAEAFNVGINNGKTAGQEIPHIHIHIIPRFPEDGLQHWPQGPYEQGEISVMGEKIRNNI